MRGATFHVRGFTMAVADIERDVFGEQIHPITRAVAGVIAAIGVAGHVALGVAVALLFYILLAGM
ncbi:hypothetical protein GCM10028856_07830 [Halopiger thermotolerans]